MARLAQAVALCSARHRCAVAARAVPEILGSAFQAAASSSRSPSHRCELRRLIAQMVVANPLWRAPRIHGELKMLGIAISERTVSRILRTLPRSPSQSWKTFLNNHVGQILSVDFFTVPTITLKVLYVFVVLAHRRREVLHFNVTDHPTAEWIAQQVVEACAYRYAPKYLIRDRDRVY